MAATLASYNPQIYASEALPLLYDKLGFSQRVYRDPEQDRNAQRKGEYINVRRPGTFTVQDAPGTAEDVQAENVQIQLNYWREVKWKLTDKELALSDEQIVEDHIEPAMNVLAADIDAKGRALYYYIGRKATNASSGLSAAENYTNVRKALRDGKVPNVDTPGAISYMIDPFMEQIYLKDSGFTQHQGAGLEGQAAQRTGSIGVKFGLETFVTQETEAHTGGTGADLAGAMDGAAAKHAASITIDGLTNGETFKAGDTFSIAGDTTKYAITADVTVASAEVTVSIEPPLRQAAADNAVVTFDTTENFTGQGMAFHKNAFCLAMAPLSQMGNELGAQIGFANDSRLGLSLRARKFYDGDASTVYFAFDVLFGWKVMDGRLAVRHGY